MFPCFLRCTLLGFPLGICETAVVLELDTTGGWGGTDRNIGRRATRRSAVASTTIATARKLQIIPVKLRLIIALTLRLTHIGRFACIPLTPGLIRRFPAAVNTTPQPHVKFRRTQSKRQSLTTMVASRAAITKHKQTPPELFRRRRWLSPNDPILPRARAD